MVDADGFEPPCFLRARFTVSCNQPLCHASIFGGVSRVRTYTALGRLPGYSRMPFLSGVYSILINTLSLRFLTRFKVAKENVYIKANCHHHHTSPFYRGHVCPVCFNMTNFFIYKKISHPRHRPFAACL